MKYALVPVRAAATIIAAFAVLAGTARADVVKYQSQFGGSKVRMEGTSTVHDWHSESTLIGGSMEIDSAFPLDGSAKPGPVKATAEVKIPVRSLKCSSGASMDSVMQSTMKAEANPSIIFTLKELMFRETKTGEPLSFMAKGEITVAGVKKDVTIPVTMTPEDDGKLKVSGVTTLKMTQFGMDPPAPKVALGFIKTGDDVTIKFDWITKKAAK